MKRPHLDRRTLLQGMAVVSLAACDRAVTPGSASPMQNSEGRPAPGDAGAMSADARPADTGLQGPDAGLPVPDAGLPSVDGGVAIDAGPMRCTPTRGDALGPFHRPNAPFRAMIASAQEPGDRLLFEGRVVNDACVPIAGAVVDVWQADRDGNYDEVSNDFRLRGRARTDAEGRFAFESVRPGHYPLNNSMRPAHLHVIVSGANVIQLTTQIYFAGDPFLHPNDPCTGNCDSSDPARIMTLSSAQMSGVTWWQGATDLVVRTA